MERITGHTVLTGLLGSPVSHSISPLMHNAAFAIDGLPYCYLCFESDENHLDSAVKGLVALNARGWNCTMPDKQRMAELCDILSPAAELTGSVNTVVNDHGVLTGYNTDGTGFMRSLEDAGLSAFDGPMILLGAGGAARSILVQAVLDGVPHVTVFNRPGSNFDKAKEIIEKLNDRFPGRAEIFDFSDQERFDNTILGSTLLVNGTNVGMGSDDRSLVENTAVFHSKLSAADIIYNPRETRLLREAREHGCKTANGLYMLLYQGSEAYRLWTGKNMPEAQVKAMYFDN